MNPRVKVGDKIIVKASVNGAPRNFIGKTCKVIGMYDDNNTDTRGGFYINVKYEKPGGTSQTCNLFNNYQGYREGDQWILPTRESQIKAVEEEIKVLDSKKKKLESELEFLTKYKSEEEFVASKIDALMSAYDKGGTKKTRVKVMTEILQQMKESHLL